MTFQTNRLFAAATPALSQIVTLLDPEDRLVRVFASGFWTPHEIDRHFDELSDVFDEARRLWGPVRMLSDMTGSPVQSIETLARIDKRTRETFRPSERIAGIVDSSLMKLQIRRVVNGAEFQVFLSPQAAYTWLNAYR